MLLRDHSTWEEDGKTSNPKRYGARVTQGARLIMDLLPVDVATHTVAQATCEYHSRGSVSRSLTALGVAASERKSDPRVGSEDERLAAAVWRRKRPTPARRNGRPASLYCSLYNSCARVPNSFLA